LHPLLGQFSEQGNKFGYGPMLRQPLVQDMTDAQWERTLRKDGSFRLLNLWNRHRAKDESVCLMPAYHIPGPRPPDMPFAGSGITIRQLPDELLTEPILTGMLEATIASFHPDHALVATGFEVPPAIDMSAVSQAELDDVSMRAHDYRRRDRAEWQERLKALKGGFDFPVWRFWLKLGEPWPLPGTTVFEPWQSAPADEEVPCWGGTLYTWHSYAPWNLPAESDWTR
jgi:hypothetical protein